MFANIVSVAKMMFTDIGVKRQWGRTPLQPYPTATLGFGLKKSYSMAMIFHTV